LIEAYMMAITESTVQNTVFPVINYKNK